MNNPKKYKYPVKQNEGQYYTVPRFNSSSFNVPSTIIPKYGDKNHNVAGTIKTTIHLKNAKGEELNFTQSQQVLNLLNGANGYWAIGGNNNPSTSNSHNNNYNFRRKK